MVRQRLYSIFLLCLAGALAAACSVPASSRAPLPPVSYFVLSASLERPLRQETRLSEGEWAAVEAIAWSEQTALLSLRRGSDAWLAGRQDAVGRQAHVQAYNLAVERQRHETQRQLEQALGKPAWQRLHRWMAQRWPVEIALHGLPVWSGEPGILALVGGGPVGWLAPAGAPTGLLSLLYPPKADPAARLNTRSASIFATRYDSKGVYTVALPDQCLKFANRGSHFCDDRGYIAGGDYSVILSYQDSLGVSVLEAGPWNIDDNFWASLADPTPRRMFADLAVGMPEAQAAFYNGYNGGVDQYGRKVTAPFALDLSFEVAKDLGLPERKNDWVTASFMWTADWGAGSGSSGASSGGGKAAPIEASAPREDGSIVHEVKNGQTLWGIAIAYGVTIQQIRDLNGLGESSVITLGQVLTIKNAGPTWTPRAVQNSQPPGSPQITAGVDAGATQTALASLPPAKQTSLAQRATRTAKAVRKTEAARTPEPETGIPTPPATSVALVSTRVVELPAQTSTRPAARPAVPGWLPTAAGALLLAGSLLGLALLLRKGRTSG